MRIHALAGMFQSPNFDHTIRPRLTATRLKPCGQAKRGVCFFDQTLPIHRNVLRHVIAREWRTRKFAVATAHDINSQTLERTGQRLNVELGNLE